MPRLVSMILSLIFAGTMLAADPFTGTWRLDPTRSSDKIPQDETVVVGNHGKTFTVEVQVTNGGSSNAALVMRYTAPNPGGQERRKKDRVMASL